MTDRSILNGVASFRFPAQYSIHAGYYCRKCPVCVKYGESGICAVFPEAVKQWRENKGNIFLEEIITGIMPFEAISDTMSFTGRRPKDLCGYEASAYVRFVVDLTEVLYIFYLKGVRRFLSGGAQGLDQMAFWAVHRLKTVKGCTDVKNILYLPFEGQELRWAETGCFSQKEYCRMKTLADEIHIISDSCSPKALFIHNHAMVDGSDILLGLYPDDTWRTSGGGTAECLRYAVSCKKKRPMDIFQMKYTIQTPGLVLTDIMHID